MLIDSPRLSTADRDAWRMWEAVDRASSRRLAKRLEEKAERAAQALAHFTSEGPCYLGVSWGKDSVVVAHLAALAGVDVPAVWVRVRLWENPDCECVRDAFLARWPLRYEEIVVDAGSNRGGGTSKLGFKEAARRHGGRYITGVRAAESTTRELTIARNGLSSASSCRPIGRWTTEEVFAYVHAHDLPLHPVYGMTLGGTLEREWRRVGSLGGTRGNGHGRAEWEQHYYGDVLAAARSHGT